MASPVEDSRRQVELPVVEVAAVEADAQSWLEEHHHMQAVRSCNHGLAEDIRSEVVDSRGMEERLVVYTQAKRGGLRMGPDGDGSVAARGKLKQHTIGSGHW